MERLTNFLTGQRILAFALPPRSKGRLRALELQLDNPFRLYCYPISEEILIVFNGGIKRDEYSTHQDSPELSMKFQEAQGFCKRIIEALQDGLIKINQDRRIIESFDQQEEILL
jgi:hypothetical protein